MPKTSKIPKMPKGIKPTERSFMVQYIDDEGDIRESGSWQCHTFCEADDFAKIVRGTVIGWDECGRWMVVVDYSKKPKKKT